MTERQNLPAETGWDSIAECAGWREAEKRSERYTNRYSDRRLLVLIQGKVAYITEAPKERKRP